MSDTLIRATSKEFPGVYDELSIHTFADFNLQMQNTPEVLYDTVNRFKLDPIMDGYRDWVGATDWEDLIGVSLSGAGSMEIQPLGTVIFNAPSTEQTTNFHLYIKEYPTYSRDVQVNTVFGGPIGAIPLCFEPDQWYISGGNTTPNYPKINSIYYQYAPIGELMTVRLGVSVNAPAAEPVHTVKIVINDENEYYGPFALTLESGTGVNGVWSATFPTPDVLCRRDTLILDVSNALFTAQTTLPGISENPPARPLPSGVYYSSFNPGNGADSNISQAILQPDGKIVIVGAFTHYNSVAMQRIARLNPDGSLDATFDPGSGADWTVKTVTLQPDGKILIGGMFSSFNGTQSRGIVRLNTDGSVDETFDPGEGFDHMVNTILLQPDGKIFVGGNFARYDNVPAYDLIRLNADGSIDTSFNAGIGADKAVKDALLLANGKFIIVGDFERYDRINIPHIARINSNGTFDPSYAHPYQLAGTPWFRDITLSPQGNMYVSGLTSTMGYLLRLNSNGEADIPIIGYGLVDGYLWDGAVYSAIELPDGRVLLGGSFYQRVPPNTSGISDPVPHLMMLNHDGSWDTSFTAFTNQFGTIDQLLPVSETQVLAVGRFSVIDGVDSNGIALLSMEKAPDFLTNALPNAALEQLYSFQLKASGLPLPAFSMTAGFLPGGMILDPITGVISGTPTETGVFNFTVEASNGIDPVASQNLSLTVLFTRIFIPFVVQN